MKILSLSLTALFLVATSSVAQIRYALTSPKELLFVFINFAMAYCIYKLVLNSTKIKIPTNFRIRIPSNFTFRRNQKIYKMS
jgi:hypothetical protein